MEEVKIDETPIDKEKSDDYSKVFTNTVITDLSDGLITKYKPHLQKTKAQLLELTEKQEILIEQLHDENLKVSWTQNSVDLHKMFDTVCMYHNKLNTIKKDMRSLYERNLKLKKRAIKLQQLKEKMEYVQNQQKEMDLKREQELIGKSNNST